MSRARRGLLLVCIALLAALSSLGCPSDRGGTPGTGTPARRQDGNPSAGAGGGAPLRIISCAPNLTEMLFALGAGDRVIGVTRYCQFPPEATTRPPLGDLFNPNLEAMVAARPDMIVFVPGSTRIPEFFTANPGPRLLETNACETIAEIQATILELGSAVGAPDRGEALVGRMNAGLDSLRGLSTESSFSYLMILGHDEGALEQIYVVGQATYLTELMTILGGSNVVPASSGRYPILTRESILQMNPDLIIERHLGRATPARRRELIALWTALPTLKAVRSGSVRVLDDDHVTINGPGLVEAARALRDCIRGEDSGG